MPQSLNLGAPSQPTNKRPRSRDSRKDPSRPGSAGQTAITHPVGDAERLARTGIRLPSYLNKTKSEITASFENLEWKQRYRLNGAFSNPNSPFHIDRSEPVVSRNRYANVQPWDASRIKLKTPIGGSDYVNASPISLRSLTPSSRQRGRRKKSESEGTPQPVTIRETRYIATQGPKEGQFSHFWHMAFQQTTGPVGVIVMLTQCYEGLREKCAEYFPKDMDNAVILLPPEPRDGSQTDSDGDPFLDYDSSSADTDSQGTGTNTISTETAQDESINPAPAQNAAENHTEAGRVELLSINHDARIGSEVRELKVTIGDASKKFYHFFYGKWADFGRVEPEDRVALLQLTRTSKELAGTSPRIVHCSAGVGRTGTWIALDFLLRELEEGRFLDQIHPSNLQNKEQNPDTRQTDQDGKKETWGRSGHSKTTTPEPKENDLIHDTVDLLRTQRMMMVINETQYNSLYEVVREQFLDKYAEKETGPVVSEGAGVSVEEQEPSPKVARLSQTEVQMTGLGAGVGEGTKADKVRGEEDGASEAETEIDDEDGMESVENETQGGVRMGELDSTAADGDDPYAAADPKNNMGVAADEGSGEAGKRSGRGQDGNER